MDAGLLESIIQIPCSNSMIWKEECAFCFENSESNEGLFLSLSRYISYCSHHFCCYINSNKTKDIFMNIKKTKLAKSSSVQKSTNEGSIKSLKIEYENEEFEEIESSNGVLYVENQTKTVLDNIGISFDDKLKLCITNILNNRDIFKQTSIENWDGSKYIVSKHSQTLQQLPVDHQIDITSSNLKCFKCDLTNNLWLNLTDGSIMCGRKQYDGTGGNNHAHEHYKQFNYPLAVKIGTITKDSSDVYSYDEDDMVIDSNLDIHLKHFGICRNNLVKKEKTILEMEIDKNKSLKLEEAFILESDKVLQPFYGNGLVGFDNLGNSCYFNSVIQLLFSLDAIINQSLTYEFDYSQRCPTLDIAVQCMKIKNFMKKHNSTSKLAIEPKMLKISICKDHPEFRGAQQQDAFEFWIYFMEKWNSISLNSNIINFKDFFTFKVQDSYILDGNKTYEEEELIMHHTETFLTVPISLDMLENDDSQHEFSCVKWDSIWSKLLSREVVDWFENNKSLKASRSSKIIECPKYLTFQLRRYFYENNRPNKQESKVCMPFEIDIKDYVDVQKEPTRKNNTNSFNDVQKNSLVNQLVEIGMDFNVSRKVIYDMNITDLDQAINLIIDNNFESVESDSRNPSASIEFDQESLDLLISMGFSKDKSIDALKNTNGSIERSIDYLYSRQESNKVTSYDKSTNYKLVGFVSHIGTNVNHGHYICHIKKNDQWIVINDDKVAISENPPVEFGYFYIYEQVC